MIDHCRRADDPGVLPPVGVPPLFCAEHAGLLLRLPDEEHALVALERSQVLVRHVVLPLSLLEGDQVDPLGCDEALDGVHEALTHRGDHDRGGHPDRQLRLQEVDEAGARLQRRDVGVEIHPVDRFQLKSHVVLEDFSNVFAYHGYGAPGERGRHGHRPE